jgi:hypothetical protein
MNIMNIIIILKCKEGGEVYENSQINGFRYFEKEAF